MNFKREWQNLIVCTIALLWSAPLSAASLHGDAPELPNAFTFIKVLFRGSPLAEFLSNWDSVIFALLLAIAIALVCHMIVRKATLIPSSWQNGLETFIELIYDKVIEIVGPQGKKYVPFLASLFIYIVTMNWLGLIPMMMSPTSDLNVTAALAISVFAVVQYSNIKSYGFFGFLHHLAGSPKGVLEWALSPLIFLIELLTQFVRPFTLALRLFGNVVGEDIMIGALALFGVLLLAPEELPIGIPLQIPFMFFSLLMGLIQASVFTLLSAIYILLSIPHGEEYGLE